MPDADRDQLRDWAHTLTLGARAVARAQLHVDDIMDASDHMTDHVLEAIEWKRAHPADDLLTALIAAEDDGDRLTADELVDQVVLLFIAGHETTVNLIGNGTLALLRNRAQLERWQRDPALDANAVDELLRYDAPVQFSRASPPPTSTSTASTIAAGGFVFVVLGSANRDPGHWGDDADAARPHPCRRGASTCRSAAASTTASARRWPASRGASRSARWSSASPRWSWPPTSPKWNGRLILRGLDELPVSLGS